MGIVLRYSSLHQHINTNKEDELLSGYNPDSPPQPGAGILRMVQETLEKCLQQPGLRFEVLHAGGGSHSRGAHRGGHQRPRTSHRLRSDKRGLAKIPSDALAGLLEDVPALTEV